MGHLIDLPCLTSAVEAAVPTWSADGSTGAQADLR